MRFMMIVKASKASEAGTLPSEAELVAMGKFNEELVKSGAMLAGEGLHASAKGARVKFANGKTTIVDGPFAETKELVAGFWLIDVKSKEEALAWARKVPFVDGEIEVRQVAEAEDFAASDPTGEVRKAEEALRNRVAAQQR